MRAALTPPHLDGACAKFYPKCCSYHEGWDDAMLRLTLVRAGESTPRDVLAWGVQDWLSDSPRDPGPAIEHARRFADEMLARLGMAGYEIVEKSDG